MAELPEHLILYILNKYLTLSDRIKNKLISTYYNKKFYNLENLINLYSKSLKFNYLLCNEIIKKESFHEEKFKTFFCKTAHKSIIYNNDAKLIKIQHYLTTPFGLPLEITKNDINKIKNIIKNDFNKLNKKSFKIKIYLSDQYRRDKSRIYPFNLIIY